MRPKKTETLDDPVRSKGLFDGVLEKPFNLSALRKTIDAAGVALRRGRVTA
jgi:2-keto-4-pentenoate hydratase